MQLTLRVLVAIIIAVIVVVALFGAASGIISQIGETVTGTSDNQSSTLNCILGNPQNEVDECSPTSVEIEQQRYEA